MRRLGLVLIAVTLHLNAQVLPDLRAGNIDGKVALLQWPATMPVDGNHDPVPLSSADGCFVFLVPHSDANQEIRYPCGKWFAPPPNQYNVWLETDGGITPKPGMVIYSGSPFRGQGLAAITPVAPAGRIAIPADRTMSDREQIRVVSIENTNWWNRNAAVFDRRVSAANAKTPVQMPAGRVVVGRFDRATNDAIALSKPVLLKAGQTSRVWPVAPVASDVLLILDKPRELQLKGRISAQLLLNSRAPDVFLDAFERVIAIWYGVDSRVATISLKSDAAFWPSQEVRFVPGRVTTIRSRLQRLPSATVSILAPPGTTLPEGSMLEVSRAEDERVLQRMPGVAGEHELQALPPEPLRFTLRVEDWTLVRDVDLSAGVDEKLAFELQPIDIAGTVFYGDEPSRAELTFLNRGEWAANVKTDEHGRYRTTLWWPKTHAVRLTLHDSGVPPFVESFVDIAGSGTVDFHIPRTDYIVHVRDAKTGRGIAGARVSAGNIWLDADSRERTTSAGVIADENGRAVLPPLQSGEVVIEAEAERYGSMEPLHAHVDKEHHEIDIALQPSSIARHVQLALPGGAPAARAEIWAFDAAMRPLWRGTTADDGSADIPSEAGDAWLVIRHANAATSVRRSHEDGAVWTLEPPAQPLTIAVDRAGGEHASSAHVALWVDGVKLTGAPLTFATWSAPAANASGIWVGRNLPPRAIRVLALASEDGDAIATNAYDAAGREIGYPWAARVKTTTPR